MNKKDKGNLGENIAAEFLQKSGYTILERNWRNGRLGEIDIIATKNNHLIFVEVKARSSTNYGHPFEAINENKITQIRSVAQVYMASCDKKYKSYSIDGISIIFANPPKIEHLKNIF